MAVLYRRAAAYEAQLAYVDAKLDEHDAQIDELHSRVETMEELSRLVLRYWSGWDRRPSRLSTRQPSRAWPDD